MVVRVAAVPVAVLARTARLNSGAAGSTSPQGSAAARAAVIALAAAGVVAAAAQERESAAAVEAELVTVQAELALLAADGVQALDCGG